MFRFVNLGVQKSVFFLYLNEIANLKDLKLRKGQILVKGQNFKSKKLKIDGKQLGAHNRYDKTLGPVVFGGQK